MDEFRRTIPRREKLINLVIERIGEVSYDNDPIGYCYNEGCTLYNDSMHIAMKNGMLDGIKDIRKALDLIEKTIKYSEE